MEQLSRPVAPESWADRARAWITWFGPARLVAACVATLIVSAGALWLVRSPAPPTEASLPTASVTPASAPTSSPPSSPSPASDPTTPGAPGGDASDDAVIVVHVAGAVVEPGVFELESGARVRDALVAAGGPVAGADWNALNLAAALGDGTRVYVPAVDEEVDTALVTGGEALGPSAGAPSDAPIGPVDINRADVVALEALPGVGPATATAIVTDRDRNGPFVSVDDLERVPGIGPAKLDALRDLVST